MIISKEKVKSLEQEIIKQYKLDAVISAYRYGDILFRIPSFESIIPYSVIPKEIENTNCDLIAKFGLRKYFGYNKYLLLKAMEYSLDRKILKQIPIVILQEWEKWCDRVSKDIIEEKDNFYSFNNDLYLKDLAVCRLKMLPAICHLLELLGIERKLMFRGGGIQFYRIAVITITNKNKFYYQSHVDKRYLDEFNPEGRKRCYLATAQLISKNLHVNGMFSSSWYNDPVLDKISPHLSYLREYPIKHGANLFRVGKQKSDIENSLMKSKTRRKYFENGKYMPTSYMWIWPRSKLLNWARNERDLNN